MNPTIVLMVIAEPQGGPNNRRIAAGFGAKDRARSLDFPKSEVDQFTGAFH